MRKLVLILFVSAINAIPISEVNNEILPTDRSNSENVDTSKPLDKNASENDVDEQPRAGIIDELNPFNNKPDGQPQTSNKDDGGNNNNPLGAIQNLFSNAPQFLNGSNPFEQLFSSQPGGNFLDNIKLFIVGTQGMVMPASAIFGGFQNLIQAFGNMQNLLPSLPSSK